METLHKEFARAGSDVLQALTFNANDYLDKVSCNSYWANLVSPMLGKMFMFGVSFCISQNCLLENVSGFENVAFSVVEHAKKIRQM